MSRVKISKKERKPVTKKWVTVGDVRTAIFAVKRPPEWRKGQFVFNIASSLYGDSFVRSIGYDPFYNDENIVPFIEALTEALNKAN